MNYVFFFSANDIFAVFDGCLLSECT